MFVSGFVIGLILMIKGRPPPATVGMTELGIGKIWMVIALGSFTQLKGNITLL